MTKHTFVGVVAVLIVLAIMWYGGIDFNQRGPSQAYWVSVSLIVGICVASLSKSLRG